MKDFSQSSRTEPSLPQFNVSHPRRVDPGTDAQPVESTRQQTEDGAGARVQQAPMAKSSRLFFIDHLRAFLIILVLMHHLALTYRSVGAGVWYYQETATNARTAVLLSILVVTDQAFFMGLFFLISAYFTPGAYDRKGAGPFLRDKLLRLGLPLLIYDSLIDPFVHFIATGFPGSYWNFYTSYLLSFRGIQGPVWFIASLLFFVLLYALWRQFSTRGSLSHPRMTTTTRSITPARTPPYPTSGEMLLYIVGLALITFLIRIWLPVGWTFPVGGFLMFPYFAQYISLFILGLIAYRRGWFPSIPDVMGKRWLWVAIIDLLLLPLFFKWGGIFTHSEDFAGGLHWQAFVLALWEAIMCVAMCTGLLVLFRKRVNRQGRVWNFLSANAYTVYLIHPLILVGLAYGLHPVALYPLLKYGIAVLIAVPCCFALSALVRMIPYAKRIL